ncbi:MAG TPA: hypothetical protein G4O14_02790 [Anaerolineae bacterium]|nr:hypothetical protein [Anaerolineae bacterium]
MAKKKIDEAELDAVAEELAPEYEIIVEETPDMYNWGPSDLEPLLSEINTMRDVNVQVSKLFREEPFDFRALVIIGLIGILKEL